MKDKLAAAVRIQKTFSPPPELQGGGDAILVESYDKHFHHCVMVLCPKAGRGELAMKTNTALYAWAITVQSQIPLRAMTNFFIDGNGRPGAAN